MRLPIMTNANENNKEFLTFLAISWSRSQERSEQSYELVGLKIRDKRNFLSSQESLRKDFNQLRMDQQKL